MCGIAGILSPRGLSAQALRQMTGALRHRGPDDEGVWLEPEVGIGLGHRRLSILDLTPAGHQPMHSADGRFVLTYNGEIYNHQDIRGELEELGGVPEAGWRGHSDTEVLLQAIVAWGLKAAVERCVGMFALGLWDRRERTLSLVRDRFGEKPLYYGSAGRDFVFGSELKALTGHPRFESRIDRRAIGLFAARTYIPAPFSIYEGVFKLPPGCILTINPHAIGLPLRAPPKEGDVENGVSLERYWSYRDVMLRGLEDPIEDEVAALRELERTLATAIGSQSLADVPVGAFLSGGIDSATICALYQKYSTAPVRTFSIGFEEAAFNEANYAKLVAKHLGTVHDERYVTVKEAQEIIPLLPAMFDEPFADSSQIPTYLVSRFAREGVTVALTGDGGDELFAGYNRHFAAPRLWEHLQKIPQPLRAMIGSPLSRVPSSAWSALADCLPGRHQPHLGAKLQKALRVATTAENLDDVYLSFLDEWSHETSPVIGNSEQANALFDLDVGANVSETARMMYCDAVSYLPDDILTKVDRASMAVSLETRVPFLDHRVAELAARIPLTMKVRGGRGKHILRELLYSMVPRELVERPKAGFGIPVGQWIKGPLRGWAEDLLDPGLMRSQGWLKADVVQKRWREHLSGRRDSAPALWAILMFQSWLQAQGDRDLVPAARAAE